MRSRVLRVPVWLLLTGIVVVSAGIRLWLVRAMVAPFIFVDELFYSELAKSLWDTGTFAVRGVPLRGYSLTYPAIVAPAWGLFDDGVTAYNAAKSINAVVMSLAAVPTYFLAARVVRPPLALLAAAIAVAVPSMAYTGTITTECLFYPVALCFALALVVYLERPATRSLVVLLVALGVAYATRSQALVFVPVIATAPLVLALVRGSRDGLRRFVPLWLVLAIVPLLGLLVVVVLGRSPLDLLGTYREVGEQHYDVAQILRFWLWHVEELTLYAGIVPVVALGILLARGRSVPERVQEHVAATATMFVWSTFAVAMFASRFASDRVQDRYLFFLTPLLAVALVAWVELGAPRPRPTAYVIGGAALLLTLVFPYARFIGEPAKSDTLGLIPLWAFQEHLLAGSWWGTVAVAGVAFLALFFLVRARHAYVVPLVLLGLFVVLSRPVWTSDKGFVHAGKGALRQGITAPSRTWIDDAVGGRGEVVALYTQNADRFTVQMNEFFNRSIGQVLYTKTSTPGGVGETHVAVSRDRPPTGELVPVYGDSLYERPPSTYPGRRIVAPFALLDSSVDPVGKPWARDKTVGMTLWRLDGPLADLTEVRGIYPYPDTWSGRTVTWQRVRCRPGALVVGVHSDPNLFSGRQTLVAKSTTSPRAVVARIPVSVDTHTITVPVSPDTNGVCRVRFTVTPTANPSKVIPGSTDDRVLGMHFESFRYLPRLP